MSFVAHPIADLLYPHVTRTPADLLAQYPPRSLPAGAQVTRFAPSPTGFVHIGSILTALVSRGIAHASGGVFILRIEDTDKKREQDGSVEAIVRNLVNFGLRPDEGIVQVEPETEHGAYAPYTQSQRMALYEAFARQMVAEGRAYPCFATEAELDTMRKIQEASHVRPGYYGPYAKWRDASVEAVQAELDAGRRPVIRIRSPYPTEARLRLHDPVKGDLDLPVNDQDSVLIKSNGLPTYHFAVVVDDTLMRVTLAIRGDEWLPSAPLHMQVYEYLNLTPPVFAHIAPIAKMDGTSKRKLSKRKDPEANVQFFYEQGYPKQAVAEYLLNLANSDFYEWRKANPALDYTEFPLKLENMGVSSALFDLVKLNDVSKDVIATYTADQVYEYGVTWARQYDPALAALLEAEPAYTRAVFNVERMGDAPRKDLVNWSDIDRAVGFFYDARYVAGVADGYAFPAHLPADDVRTILEYVRGFDFEQPKEDWLEAMRSLSEQTGYARDMKSFKKAAPGQYKGHFGDVMMAVRVGLTGKTNTPDLHEMARTLGHERVRDRLAQAVATLG